MLEAALEPPEPTQAPRPKRRALLVPHRAPRTASFQSLAYRVDKRDHVPVVVKWHADHVVRPGNSIFCRAAAVSFRPLPDHELQQLADEQLIAYIRNAMDAGQLAHGRRGLAILVFGYVRDIKRRLSIKVLANAVGDLARDALVKAIAAAFDGSSAGVPQLAAYDRRPHRSRLLPARRAAPQGDVPP